MQGDFGVPDWPPASVSIVRPTKPTLKQRLGYWVFDRLHLSRFFFDQARTELAAAGLRWKYFLLPWRRRERKRLLTLQGAYVNVACGPGVAPALVNIDLFPCAPDVVGWDCRWSLPFADDSVAGIRAEQFVEHLEPREELRAFFGACRRTLRPGGVLRIIVPDAERYLRAYCEGGMERFRELAVVEPLPDDLPTRMDVVNHIFHQWHEHRWGYDYETLEHRLKSAGFREIRRSSFRESAAPPLAVDLEHHRPYSLYVEAVK